MTVERRTSVGWIGVAIAALTMVSISGLITYPNLTNESILTALRVSSLTTALILLLVFVTKPLVKG